AQFAGGPGRSPRVRSHQPRFLSLSLLVEQNALPTVLQFGDGTDDALGAAVPICAQSSALAPGCHAARRILAHGNETLHHHQSLFDPGHAGAAGDLFYSGSLPAAASADSEPGFPAGESGRVAFAAAGAAARRHPHGADLAT